MVSVTEELELWTRTDIESVLGHLRSESVRTWGVPQGLARRASTATRGGITWDCDCPERSEARVEAYFWAVLRRLALTSRDKGLAPLKARFALATIVEDMRARGMTPEMIRDRTVEQHAELVEACGFKVAELDVAC